jgi:hypothetical protein
VSSDDSGPVGAAVSVALDEVVSTPTTVSSTMVVAGGAETSFCWKLLVSTFIPDEGIWE